MHRDLPASLPRVGIKGMGHHTQRGKINSSVQVCMHAGVCTCVCVHVYVCACMSVSVFCMDVVCVCTHLCVQVHVEES